MTEQITWQFRILTGLQGCWRGERLGLCANPFYKATKQEVLENWDYAVEIYRGVFTLFLTAWCTRKARDLGLIPDTTLRTTTQYQSVIDEAVRQGIIKLPPEEWKELRL
jgi:hypothetical protein